MDYIIEKFSENKHAISETESVVIKRAIPFYNNLLERYESMLLKAKEENDKLKNDKGIGIDNNPFDVNSAKEENQKPWDLPSLKEIKTFVYSSWAKTVADVQTPFGSSGQRKKGIVKTAFRDVQKGKYINKNVREIANNFISRILLSLNIEKNETL